MFEIGGLLFARGAVGALAAGFVCDLALLLAWAPSESAPLLSWWNVSNLAFGAATLGLLFAPLTMIVLPLTWMVFRRSRYRYVALFGMGLLGGVVWSEILRDDLSLYPSILVVALSGLSAASCFLGLPGSTPAASSQQTLGG